MTEIDNFLQECLEKNILIKLKDNKVVQGKLHAFDEQMNLSLDDARDITENEPKTLNNIILRGSMILTVSPID